MSRWADTDSDSDDEFQTHGDAGMVLQSINANLIGQVSFSSTHHDSDLLFE